MSWASAGTRRGDPRRRGRPSEPGRQRRVPVLALLALYLALSTLFAATLTNRLRRPPDPPPPAGAASPKPAKYLVLMVLDGARPDYFGLTHLPHVDALRAAGTQFNNAMDGILESETPSGHTTISTGSPPSRNGILGFDWSQNDSDLSLFSPTVVRAGTMEKIMQAAHVPTIASLYKGRYPGARVVALSGHKYYAADPLGGPAADAIMYYQGNDQGRYVPVAIPGHMPPPGVLTAPGVVGASIHLGAGAEDDLATHLALSAFKVMHQRITLINYPEFDWPLGHVDGGIAARQQVIERMIAFDQDLGSIERAYAKAGILSKTLFVITADHGMEVVHRFIPHSLFTDAITAAGTTAPAISYNAGAYIWLADGTKAEAVAGNITHAADPGIQSVYYLDTSTSVSHYVLAPGTNISAGLDAANQYLLGTLMNGHQPSVVAFCTSGATTSPSTTNWKADHGGASWQSQHIPLIFAGPMIRSGVVVDDPAQLEDVATTTLTAMGVRPTGMTGHVLTEALLRSSRAGRADRSQEIKTTTPIVNALIAQDTVESRG